MWELKKIVFHQKLGSVWDKVERVKAYVVLRQAKQAGPGTEAALIAYCRERLIKWSCPRDIEFRGDLPRTRVGKIDYRALVDEHIKTHGPGATSA